MSSDLNTLMEMGFPENRAQKALAKTGFKGAQLAMDWLFSHEDDADIDVPYVVPEGNVLGKSETATTSDGAAIEAGDNTLEKPAEEETLEAKCLKCDDCGKLLKTEIDVQAHAARSGHSNFSESTEEIKPLTEEEKKAQLQKVQDLLKQRRLDKIEEEKKERIQREKMRRATGKDIVSAKAKMEEMEMKKLAEEKRREKEEERKARQRVKDNIERDRRERASKFGKKTEPSAGPASDSPKVAEAAPQAPTVKKEYDQCRLQIRLQNGQALTQTFGAKEQLAAVRLYVEINRTDEAQPFSLMTTFPRKIFTEEDMMKPLTELGLVPSAVLTVTKKT